MLRRALLFLSERQGLKDQLLRIPLFRRVARRFVAGDTLPEALGTARELNRDGFRVTLDLLGESVADRAMSTRAVKAYEESLTAIDGSDAETTISLKLTQLGLEIDEGFCLDNLRRIVEHAARLDNFVRIDMEGSDHTGATLSVFRRVFRDLDNVGVVIQSYLRRSRRDVEELVDIGAPVRLCKGAYDEPPEVAYQDPEEVDASFVRLMELLLDGGAPTAIASHDERMIRATWDHMEASGLERGDVEFQMLYGVRRELQRSIVDEGHPMRIYVPYGSEWYSYLMRRMAERPANLWLVLRSLAGG
ncbi:MAG: proline dehydrogenase family protein [Gemmatimonadota bacterium]